MRRDMMRASRRRARSKASLPWSSILQSCDRRSSTAASAVSSLLLTPSCLMAAEVGPVLPLVLCTRWAWRGVAAGPH